MPKSQFQQSSFASGELSPLILGRTDLEQYYKGAQDAQNVVIVPQGGVKRRPGTEFIDVALRGNDRQTAVNPSTPNGGDGALLNDGDPNTYSTTDANVGTATGYTVAEYDLGAGYIADFVTIESAYLSRNGTGGEEIKTATLTLQNLVGATYEDFKTISITNEFGKIVSKRYDITDIPLADKREWRVRVDLNLADSANWRVSIGEFNFSDEPPTPALTTNLKTFDWEYATDFNFLVVMTEGNARFYRAPHAGSANTVYVADIPVPYTSTQVSQVRDAQTENVMLMFQEDHPPRRILFDPDVYDTSPADAFTSDTIPFRNVPQYDYNDSLSPIPVTEKQSFGFLNFDVGQQYIVTVEGVDSKPITFAGGVGLAQQESTSFNLQKNLLDMPTFGFSGVDVKFTEAVDDDGDITYFWQMSFSGESAKDYEQFSAGQFTGGVNADGQIFVSTQQEGSPRKEDVWSEARGYPGIGVFFEGRLWLGGLKSKPQSLIASRAGDYFDFYTVEGEDDEGIFITIDSRGLTDIVDINPDRGLQVFCAGSEFLVKGLTPSDIRVEAQTQHGSFNLEAKSVDGATLFVDKNGNTLRQYVFSFNEDAYTSNDISVLSSHLIDSPKDMAILAGTTTEDANWVFIINQDGGACVLNTMRAQDINGFTKWTPYSDENSSRRNELESCSVVGSELYVIVKTVSLTGQSRSVERWNFEYLLDSSYKTTVTATGSDVFVDVLDGSRLNGFTVSVIADGDVLADRVVSFNDTSATYGVTITAEELSGFTTRDLEIGLNFPVKVKTMPLNTNPGTRGGMNVMKRKKITNMNLRVYESAGIYIDGNPVAIRQFGEAPDTPLNTSFTPKTGIIEDNRGGNGWDTDVVPEITVPDGTPFHLQAIQYEVESS